jgi:formylglycine-generating enzyme required for sulfatase activity
VAEICLDLLAHDTPGATRASTLLHMMREEGAVEGETLEWGQVSRTAKKLAHDLSEGAKVASQALETGPLDDPGPRPARSRALTGTLLALAGVAALAVGGLLFTNRKEPPEVRDLSAMVEIPAGTFLNHDGEAVELPGFWIDAHEVTIAEYAAFLEALALLPEETRAGYDHPDQPASKRDHTPDSWEAMWNAARSAASYEGLPLGPNHPVVQVDWWDAWAYANWKGARLPTQEEWLAAAQDGEPVAADRGPVDRLPGDVTARGVHGLAGNVSEWVRDPARNPGFPMNPKAPLCCGASFAHPSDGFRSRRWLPSRETRRGDLGFRTVRDAEP